MTGSPENFMFDELSSSGLCLMWRTKIGRTWISTGAFPDGTWQPSWLRPSPPGASSSLAGLRIAMVKGGAWGDMLLGSSSSHLQKGAVEPFKHYLEWHHCLIFSQNYCTVCLQYWMIQTSPPYHTCSIPKYDHLWRHPQTNQSAIALPFTNRGPRVGRAGPG